MKTSDMAEMAPALNQETTLAFVVPSIYTPEWHHAGVCNPTTYT